MSPEKPARKKRRWLVIVMVLLLLAGVAAGLWVRYFPELNEQRLINKAEAFRAAGDFRAASITAQRALQINPTNLTAVRMLSEITGEAGSPAILHWRKRLVELEPSFQNRLSLAEAALELGQVTLASQTLAAVQEAGQGQVRYHELAGRTALAMKDSAKAATELASAAKLAPENEAFRLNADAAALKSPDPAIRAEARVALEARLDQADVSARVSRLLIHEAWQQREPERAVKFAEDMEKRGHGTFSDRLAYLDLLHHLKRPNYPAFLATMQEEAEKNPELLYLLIAWLNERNSTMIVADWARRLPPETAATMPVPVALAQTYVRLRKWKELKPLITETVSAQPPVDPQENTAPGPWAEYEFLRLAFLAVMHRAEGDHPQANVRWTSAMKATGDRPAAANALARYAVEWGWESDSTEVLWKVARTGLDKIWALKILYRVYSERNSTSNLQQVATQVLEIEPENRDMINNLAMLNLLLGTDVPAAMKRIRHLQQEDPENPNYLSTYALGLFLQGSTKEAVDLMKTLTPEQLQQPAIAAYYGLVLSATDAKEEARKYLEAAKEAKLLPEEKKLLAAAWQRIEPPAPDEPAARPAPPVTVESAAPEKRAE